jgi:hypothetical protein
MRKRTASCLTLLSILLVLPAILSVAAAETYVVGVPSGTVADYYYAQTGSQVNRGHLDVTNVTTTVITFNETFYNPNNSVNTTGTGLTYNVTNGLSTGTSGSIYPWFIAANLAVGTPTYSGAHIFVNETISSYLTAGATRTVNHSNQTLKSSGIPYSIFNAWWDKITGLLVKLTIHFIPGTFWVNLTLTSTSLWSGPISTETLVLATGGVCALIAVILVAVVIQRRKQSN